MSWCSKKVFILKVIFELESSDKCFLLVVCEELISFAMYLSLQVHFCTRDDDR